MDSPLDASGAVADVAGAPTPTTAEPDPAPCGNADFPWDKFDSEKYLAHNYAVLRDDDRQILELMADFFAGADSPGQLRRGIDVGSGVNLYPALAMSPLCHEITLREPSWPNHKWLTREVERYSPLWDQFWELLLQWEPYQKITDPRYVISERVRLERQSIFSLPEEAWDIGTMFFVAESITRMIPEFGQATKHFIRSLRPRAPFVAAFMRNSRGYQVGNYWFPAVAINEDDVKQCLSTLAQDVKIHIIDVGPRLRDGYEGMILATGRAATKR